MRVCVYVDVYTDHMYTHRALLSHVSISQIQGDVDVRYVRCVSKFNNSKDKLVLSTVYVVYSQTFVVQSKSV